MLTILGAAGLGVEDVTRVTENVTLSGLPDYAAAEGVRHEVFGERRPSVRTVVVERLVRRAAHLEVELHAIKGGGEVLVSSTGLDDPSEGRAPGRPRRCAQGSTAWSTSPRSCRSTAPAPWCTRVTSAPSTPGASTEPASC